MIDNLPIWLAAPLTLIFGLVALYEGYIKPGYLKDRSEHSGLNDAK